MQDVYLQSLVDHHEVKKHRPRKEEPRVRQSTFSYHVMRGSQKVPVCQKAFLSLHSVSEKRLRRLQGLLRGGDTPKELRGQAPRPNFEISAIEINRMVEHIKSFPTKTYHYSSRENTYLDARLNVTKMHELFCIKHPDTRIKYEYFLRYFKENFDLKFGRPQIDTCITCEQLGVKIKSPTLNDNAKRAATAELLLHKARAKKFYKKMREVEIMCTSNNHIRGICFDFMQNLPLPEVPVQDVFYLRQLWVYVFGVHDLGSSRAQMFVYHEGEAKKGANDVCSMLLQYIEETVPAEVTELHCFCDGCAGQNKNHTVLRFFLTLAARKRFNKIFLYFPERGHSYLPCDRDFGLIKRKVRRADRVYVPDEYHAMILAARKDPFTVKVLRPKDVKDFSQWWPQFYKKSCVPLKKTRPGQKSDHRDLFSVSSNKMYVFDSSTPGVLIAFERIDGLNHNSYKLLKVNNVPDLPTTQAYTDQVPINDKKLTDIRKLLPHIPEEHHGFYKRILSWKTTASDNASDDDEN